MPRRLSDTPNELKIYDNLSDSGIVFYYRMPTTQERVAYSNACVFRKGKKIVNKTPEARQKYGLAILTGIRDGDFEVKKNGKWAPLSSDSGSEHYDPDWKSHVQRHASDLVELLAAQVFDASARISRNEDEEEEEDGEDIEKN